MTGFVLGSLMGRHLTRNRRKGRLGFELMVSWAIEAIGLRPLLLPPYSFDAVDKMIHAPSTQKTIHYPGTEHVAVTW